MGRPTGARLHSARPHGPVGSSQCPSRSRGDGRPIECEPRRYSRPNPLPGASQANCFGPVSSAELVPFLCAPRPAGSPPGPGAARTGRGGGGAVGLIHLEQVSKQAGASGRPSPPPSVVAIDLRDSRNSDPTSSSATVSVGRLLRGAWRALLEFLHRWAGADGVGGRAVRRSFDPAHRRPVLDRSASHTRGIYIPPRYAAHIGVRPLRRVSATHRLCAGHRAAGSPEVRPGLFPRGLTRSISDLIRDHQRAPEAIQPLGSGLPLSVEALDHHVVSGHRDTTSRRGVDEGRSVD
jgi:hypothetical protein